MGRRTYDASSHAREAQDKQHRKQATSQRRLGKFEGGNRANYHGRRFYAFELEMQAQLSTRAIYFSFLL